MISKLKLKVSWLDGKEKIKCQCQSIISVNSKIMLKRNQNLHDSNVPLRLAEVN